MTHYTTPGHFNDLVLDDFHGPIHIQLCGIIQKLTKTSAGVYMSSNIIHNN